jgi:hypothetical protein
MNELIYVNWLVANADVSNSQISYEKKHEVNLVHAVFLLIVLLENSVFISGRAKK